MVLLFELIDYDDYFRPLAREGGRFFFPILYNTLQIGKVVISLKFCVCCVIFAFVGTLSTTKRKPVKTQING